MLLKHRTGLRDDETALLQGAWRWDAPDRSSQDADRTAFERMETVLEEYVRKRQLQNMITKVTHTASQSQALTRRRNV